MLKEICLRFLFLIKVMQCNYNFKLELKRKLGLAPAFF